jgi:hypothetical protein
VTTIINGSSPSITFSDGSAQTSATRPFLNRIINGAMVIDQRNAGASVTNSSSGSPTYILDRWGTVASQASKFTIQQDAGAVTPPAGFADYLGVTSSSAYSRLSTDYFGIVQPIEGFNVADLNWGSANAKTITLSFWVRSSLTGTFAGRLTNSASNRSYVFTYTINSANTWEFETITIAGDTSGTWLTTNGVGISVWFDLGSGSNYQTTAGSWQAGNFAATSSSTSVVGTNGATFYITGVQLEVGSTATSFDYRPYGTELALCQRYYQKSGYGMCGRAEAATLATLSGKYIVEMRAAPISTLLNGTNGIATFGVSTYNISSLATLANGTNDYRQAVNSTGMTTGAIINGYSESVIGWSAEL